MSSSAIKIPRVFSLSRSAVFLLVLFLLVFPKGGIKIGPVPLTWGYLFLALISFVFLLRGRFAFYREKTMVLLSLIPFQIVALSTFFVNGIENVGFTLAFITTFFALPWIFLCLLSASIEELDLDLFLPLIRRGIFFVAVFGIFLFFFKTITGSFILIPFLTINYHDMDTIEYGKSIARGDFSKLISTYQNGNIYGICLLMVLPLYNFIEKSPIKKFTVIFSLILTLSRTIWIGLFSFMLIQVIYIHRLSLKSFLKFSFQSLLFLFVLNFLLFLLDKNISFIFDRTLGGRIGQFDQFSNWALFSSEKLSGIAEIVYLGIFNHFGLIGLATFILAITSPLIIYKFSNIRSRTWSESEYTLRKSLSAGLVLYLILCCSDGAILYIPTMVFYWFLTGLLLGKRELSPLPYNDC